jgi:hypothetical protein
MSSCFGSIRGPKLNPKILGQLPYVENMNYKYFSAKI